MDQRAPRVGHHFCSTQGSRRNSIVACGRQVKSVRWQCDRGGVVDVVQMETSVVAHALSSAASMQEWQFREGPVAVHHQAAQFREGPIAAGRREDIVEEVVRLAVLASSSLFSELSTQKEELGDKPRALVLSGDDPSALLGTSFLSHARMHFVQPNSVNYESVHVSVYLQAG